MLDLTKPLELQPINGNNNPARPCMVIGTDDTTGDCIVKHNLSGPKSPQLSTFNKLGTAIIGCKNWRLVNAVPAKRTFTRHVYFVDYGSGNPTTFTFDAEKSEVYFSGTVLAYSVITVTEGEGV